MSDTVRRLALAAFLVVVPAVIAAPAPEPPRPKAGPKVEILGLDDSVTPVELLDTDLHLDTKYGPLAIPVADVVRVEFATRPDPASEADAAGHIGRLAAEDFKVRDEATAALKRMRERAYQHAMKAVRSDDPEVARRAAEVADHIRAAVPTARLVARPHDVVHTADGRFTGSLRCDVLKVRTRLFGEQRVQAHDLLSLRTSRAAAAADAAPAPANLAAYAGQFGKELALLVTAPVAPPGGGAVWGSDQYTLDSAVVAAAVHAGAVGLGETAVVRVRIVPALQQHTGSTRNGVTTTTYGPYAGGCFEFLK